MNRTTYADCTRCKNCEPHCPENSPISTIMGLFQEIDEKDNFDEVCDRFNTQYRRITSCINCCRCLVYCKQKINIPYYILQAREDFE